MKVQCPDWWCSGQDAVLDKIHTMVEDLPFLIAKLEDDHHSPDEVVKMLDEQIADITRIREFLQVEINKHKGE